METPLSDFSHSEFYMDAWLGVCRTWESLFGDEHSPAEFRRWMDSEMAQYREKLDDLEGRIHALWDLQDAESIQEFRQVVRKYSEGYAWLMRQHKTALAKAAA